ncbi:MAG: hypothetical protein ACT4P6_02395 [Gemmatimonadaceae bacterium]
MRVAHSVLRPYTASDRDAVREICCRTAFRHRGHAALLDDKEVFADYWTKYYTDYEPESILVASRDDNVTGYLLGCVDSARFVRTMARHVVPSVLMRLTWRGVSGRYADGPRTRAFFRWLLLRSWREAAPIDAARYPAHYHINLVTAGYQERLYTRLALAFVDRVECAGVTHMHGRTLDARDNGVFGRLIAAFIATHPAAEIYRAARPTSLGTDVLGTARPLVNLSVGMSTHTFRDLLTWGAARYGL